MELFSDSFYIKKIIQRKNNKIYCNATYQNTEYFVQSYSYNWIIIDNNFMGYGTIDRIQKKIYLESIVPLFQEHRDVFLFQSFLIDSKIPGLSATKISLLYEHFKSDMIEKFQYNKFDDINTILQYDEKKIDIIKNKWLEMNAYIELHLQLKKCGLSAASIKKVYKTYKTNSLHVIRDNPYQMIFQVGFGFLTVDKIAHECAASNTYNRICGAIFYVFLEIKKQGSTCIKKEKLLDEVKKLTIKENNLDDIYRTIETLIDNQTITSIKDFYALTKDYQTDLFIYEFFKNKNPKKNISLVDFQSPLISEEQKSTIIGALENQYTVITGPAGSGKSTVINEIYCYHMSQQKKIIVLTPTGRASQRIREISPHILTMTIHKFFILHKIFFQQEEHHHTVTFDYDHIIIDESSMLDSQLLGFFLKHTKKDTSITFIGDAKQLPPVSPGQPFYIMIEKNIIPVFYLTKIFRQQEGSNLLSIANKIAQGICPKINNTEEIEFQNGTKENIKKILSQYIDIHYNSNNHALAFTGITFLNRGNAGTIVLNNYIQHYINEKYHQYNTKIIHRFYKYDKIIVSKNNYKLDIRNGEIGTVLDGDAEHITLLFENEKRITLNINESYIIDLGYVINVYKSQGSEFNYIIIFLLMEQYILLHQKAIYTAITRSKKKATIIGEKKAFYCAIKNQDMQKRFTILEEIS